MSSTDKIGAWRDRTNLFISYRQSYAHHPTAKRQRFNGSNSNNDRYTDADAERAGLMSGQDNADSDAIIEMDLLPPRWLDIQDEITTLLTEVAAKMKKLDQVHAKHVLPGFDDESVKAREEREIEALTQDITRTFTTCQSRIRRIDALVREQQQHSTSRQLSQADETMARNLKMSLASRVSEVSATFRRKQSAYLKKLRSLGGMLTPIDRAGTPLAQNPYTDPAIMDSETDRSAAEGTLLQTAQLQQSQRRRTGVMDSAIEQREREIEGIAQGVIDLSNIFQELNSMVIDQGTVLDRIDYNVERTAEHVKEAEKELTVATGSQKKGTRRRVILLLVLVVVGMLILLLVKPKRGSAVPAPVPTPAPGEPLPPIEPGGGLPPEVGAVARRVWGGGHGMLERRWWEWKQRRRRGGSFALIVPI
ncbi:t-SNARE affecting a late Golgi compartment protein 2 [Friedmanniomyces endolithicus]|uniref:t-SNARE affecting a late Golgi compartment protein 2 n=1 Tax=Friedmanniomyces endolithicus TaxID=329885 RepID=A0AAN6FXT8_9PEZI|nr:t-SNARE affecting a late Golgi compartment protein 2 [Friedmanniomyces endolithicus]KAK0296867.1 t-SNARE affecting a late Golgi compartment protein 2 [Friedmanniomyces endolithicus]KAK0325413.1 t-SNARE affecting a late Golgi compartment protein 2 [Friedmanniomyces endolithicus]KAK1011136.1 t-SNARE affecting a late Golgi compartment protein 2 [Friedmanniomyces endolithicus]